MKSTISVNRKYIISGLVILVGFIFVIQLLNLQIFQKKYPLLAISNSRKVIVKQPARGLIFDRNNKLIVFNKPAHNLTITPRLLSDFDTLQLCRILEISKEELLDRIKKSKKKAKFTYTSYKFYSNLTDQQFTLLKEQHYKFKGFDIESAIQRDYAHNTAAHVIGYVSEVDNHEIKSDNYYLAGENIGKSGIEGYYEKVLRGEKGVHYFLKDNKNRIVGKYKNGRYDIQEKAGNNIWLTLDLDLQLYAEKLMENKLGSIVAIQPKTGEILAKISSPGYNLKKLFERGGRKYFASLSQDSLKTLFDRSLLARYPPGSIFKVLNALVLLQEKIVTPQNKVKCYGEFRRGRFRMGCHDHKPTVNLNEAIKYSCNSYFANYFIKLLEKENSLPRDEFEKYYNHMLSVGFGKKLNSDFANEITGFIPDNLYYDKVYKRKKWRALNIISISIGQGELLITPLQMANYACILANKGYYITPHIVKNIEEENMDASIWKKNETTIDSVHFEEIYKGMYDVVNSGTGFLAKTPDIDICGKTGTVQVPGAKDHSVFLAFAPYDNPEIAMVVYVENGGFGSQYAAPIAGLMIEKYLKGKISPNRKWLEDYIINAVLIK